MKRKLVISAFISVMLLALLCYVAYFEFYTSNSDQANKNLDTIEKVYVINLDRVPERWSHMQVFLADLGLLSKAVRFPAVDGDDLQIIDLHSHSVLLGKDIAAGQYLPEGKYMVPCRGAKGDVVAHFIINGGFCFTPRTTGEFACACSHLLVWDDIKKHNYQHALVLEDDVELYTDWRLIKSYPLFKKNFVANAAKDVLAQALLELPTDADVLYLGIFSGKKFKYIGFSSHLKKLSQDFSSAEGYMINSRAADKLLKGFNGKLYPTAIDLYMSKEVEKGNIIAYRTSPKLIRQSKKIKSNIG